MARPNVGSGAAAVAQQAQLSENPDLDNQLAYQRGIEAVIWSMPAISIRELWEASFKDYGATWNDVILWSEPAVPRHELLTANNQVPYMLTAINLRQGPVVVEIPAAGAKALLFGSFVDNWQAPIVGGLRPVPANGGTAEDANAYAQQMKVYPLSDGAAPKPTRIVRRHSLHILVMAA